MRVWPRLPRSTGPRTLSTTAMRSPFRRRCPAGVSQRVVVVSTALSPQRGRRGHYDHRMPELPRHADRRGDHLIVCGDGPLSYRITEELTSRYGERVTVTSSDIVNLETTLTARALRDDLRIVL